MSVAENGRRAASSVAGGRAVHERRGVAEVGVRALDGDAANANVILKVFPEKWEGKLLVDGHSRPVGEHLQDGLETKVAASVKAAKVKVRTQIGHRSLLVSVWF